MLVLVKVPRDFQDVGESLAKIIVDVGFAKSKTEARNHIKGGGIRLDGTRVNDPYARLAKDGPKWFLVEHDDA
jgi:tyrosyl-tRNA synthetase